MLIGVEVRLLWREKLRDEKILKSFLFFFEWKSKWIVE